jgi:hypothetical protein
MTSVSTDRYEGWKVTAHEGPPCLVVILLKRTYVMPWSQFLYAEGGDDEVRLAFTTHDVLVNGSQLGSLMADLSGQRVSLLREPARSEKFRHDGGTQITGVSVQKVE